MVLLKMETAVVHGMKCGEAHNDKLSKKGFEKIAISEPPIEAD